MSEALRRYTNLASTIHTLRSKGLTLLSPEYWDDRNDAFYMAAYKKQTGARSALALCFAEARETYHHWRVFSAGSDGVCLEFDKPRLLEAMRHVGGLKWGSVRYRSLADVRPIGTEELPFLKRIPFEDEREFRVLYTSDMVETETHHVPIPLSCIVSLSLSPWMAKALAEAVKVTLKGIDGCREIRMFRSTLVDNDKWKRVAEPTLVTEGTSA